MPRFFFDVISPVNVRDHRGMDLHDLEEARAIGVDFAEALLGEGPCQSWDISEWVLTVSDENRTVLLGITVTLHA